MCVQGGSYGVRRRQEGLERALQGLFCPTVTVKNSPQRFGMGDPNDTPRGRTVKPACPRADLEIVVDIAGRAGGRGLWVAGEQRHRHRCGSVADRLEDRPSPGRRARAGRAGAPAAALFAVPELPVVGAALGGAVEPGLAPHTTGGLRRVPRVVATTKVATQRDADRGGWRTLRRRLRPRGGGGGGAVRWVYRSEHRGCNGPHLSLLFLDPKNTGKF